MELPEFQEKCRSRRCPRNTIFNAKTCARETKQVRCFGKYTKKLEKARNKTKTGDLQWISVRDEVWRQDTGDFGSYQSKTKKWRNYCSLYRRLSANEKHEFEVSSSSEVWICSNLDPAHILSRAQRPDLTYDSDNIVIINRLFHQRIDTNRHPLTGKGVPKEQATAWLRFAKTGEGRP